jgi:hypothetical protein
MFVCLFVTMRPAGTRCICELYWHNFTSYNNNSFTRSTLLTGLSQNPRGIPQPRITLTSQAQGTKILLTTCQTSSPVEVWHMRVLFFKCNRSKTVFHNLKKVKIAKKKFENRSSLANFCQFLAHFMNKNHIFKKVGRGGRESTCSGVLKTSCCGFFVQQN